jgi:dTDP-4-amino-4,6-dideoxygalactose transaminase
MKHGGMAMNAKLAIDGGSPIREKILVFGAPALGEEECGEVLSTLRSGWIGTGPKTAEFETEFSKYIGARHAVAVSSCTAALHLSLLVSGVQPGDEVITSPLTFAATANVVIHAGARPVFADIDPNTLNINPADVERAISSRTRVLLPVHFGGLPCALQQLRQIAQKHGLILVEDAAHAVAAQYKGVMIGGSGNLACFSFYANKNLTTGEGGMVATNDEKEASLLAVYRLHGLSRDAWQRYSAHRLILSDAVYPGFKYNMTDLQSSLGIHQLRKQEKFLEIREQYACIYDEAFSDLDGVRMQPRHLEDGTRHALHLYVLILDKTQFRVGRNEIVSALIAENVGAAIHYRALHTHPYYRDRFKYRPEDFPNAAEVGDNILSLPLTPAMTEKDVQDVIAAVYKVLNAYRK